MPEFKQKPFYTEGKYTGMGPKSIEAILSPKINATQLSEIYTWITCRPSHTKKIFRNMWLSEVSANVFGWEFNQHNRVHMCCARHVEKVCAKHHNIHVCVNRPNMSSPWIWFYIYCTNKENSRLFTDLTRNRMRRRRRRTHTKWGGS